MSVYPFFHARLITLLRVIEVRLNSLLVHQIKAREKKQIRFSSLRLLLLPLAQERE